GQDPKSHPDPGPWASLEPAAAEPVLPLEAADPPLASGPPAVASSPVPGSFDGVSPALARDHLVGDAAGRERPITDDVPVAAVGGHRADLHAHRLGGGDRRLQGLVIAGVALVH